MIDFLIDGLIIEDFSWSVYSFANVLFMNILDMCDDNVVDVFLNCFKSLWDDISELFFDRVVNQVARKA